MTANVEAIKFGQPAHNRQHASYRIPPGVPVGEARRNFADLLVLAAAGEITYITNNGRCIAAVVPLAIADDAVNEPEDATE